jgi:chloramphenicol-sensitive protein RarD
VPGLQVLAHRVVWCVLAVWAWLLLRGELGWLRTLTWRALGGLSLGALLISLNWGTYVIAVLSGHVVDTSFGYFISPLASVLLAVLVLRERLAGAQKVAVLVAAVGVAWLGTRLGTAPWVALLLAASFALYGLVRKLVPFPEVPGLAVESTVLLVPAVAYLLWCEHAGNGAFGHGRRLDDVLLVVGGPLTALPLVLFAYAAQRIPMTLLGVVQYVSPTVSLSVGVWWLHEPFGLTRAVAFGIIWLALAIFTLDGVLRYRRAHPRSA